MVATNTYAPSRSKIGQYVAEHATYPLVALLTSGYVYNDMHEDAADITGELSGGGYARVTLTGVTLTTTDGVTKFDSDDITFPALTASDVDGLVIISDRGADSASPVVFHASFAPTDVTAADLPISAPADGWVKVTEPQGRVTSVAGVEPGSDGDVPAADLRDALEIAAAAGDTIKADSLIRSEGFDPTIGTFTEVILVGVLGDEGNRVATIARAVLVGYKVAVIDTAEVWEITASGPCTLVAEATVSQLVVCTNYGTGGPLVLAGVSSVPLAETGDPATHLAWTDETAATRRLNNVVTSIHDGGGATNFIEHDGGDPVAYGTIADGSLNDGLPVYKPTTFTDNTVDVGGQSYTFVDNATTVIWLKDQANADMNGAYELTADYNGDFGPADDVILYRTVVWNTTTDNDPTSPRYQQAGNLFVNSGGDHEGLWLTNSDGIAGVNIRPAKVAHLWDNAWDETEAAAADVGTIGEYLTGLSVGSGNVATDAIFDAKGDLPVGTGANTAAKLTAGADDTMLMAASGEATGLKWATPSAVRTALSLVPGTDVQAADSDLTAIAALSPSNDDIIQRKSGAWTNRTMAQLATDLRITQIAYKTADESVTSSTTVQDDDHLTFAIGANETWYCEFNLSASGGSTGDIKVTVTMPSGATSELLVTGVASGGTTAQNSVGVITSSASSEVTCGLQAGTGNRNAVSIEGVVFNGSNAGNVTLQWAQGTSDGTATTVRKGSTVIYRRLA